MLRDRKEKGTQAYFACCYLIYSHYSWTLKSIEEQNEKMFSSQYHSSNYYALGYI